MVGHKFWNTWECIDTTLLPLLTVRNNGQNDFYILQINIKLSEFFRWDLMLNILSVIYQTVVLIFIVVSCNTMFWLLYPPGGPFLSGHRNDSSWEILFKVWLLTNQSVQEIWRCYLDNNVIFHAYQFEKYHKVSWETVHKLGHVDFLSRPSIEMNPIWEPIIKRPNQIVFKENYFKNIKNNWCHWILRFEFISWHFSKNFLCCFLDWQAWKTMMLLFV